jgi:radical SAM protein with 4Fe4S-binding SPASM domain
MSEKPSAENVESVQLDPDPFALAKKLRSRIRHCAESLHETPSEVHYLWLHVSTEGISQPGDRSAKQKNPPSLEDWLNVVDEAAALGVNWLVISMQTAFSAFPDIWTICQWAQETYGISVGLHTTASALDAEDLESLKLLDPAKTRLFVKRDVMDSIAPVEALGIKVSACDPQTYGNTPNCQGAAKMVFVNPDGVLYTCGLVEGHTEYRLGTIYEKTFENIVHDPALPHKVKEEIHRVSEGCDGCPSLIANYLVKELET